MYHDKQIVDSMRLVEAARAENVKLNPRRMTAEEKEQLLASFHPDFRQDQFSVLKIGPNAGEKVPHELASLLQGKSWLTEKAVDLSKPDYDVDVLVIGGGGAGSSAAIEADEAGANVWLLLNCVLVMPTP